MKYLIILSFLFSGSFSLASYSENFKTVLSCEINYQEVKSLTVQVDEVDLIGWTGLEVIHHDGVSDFRGIDSSSFWSLIQFGGALDFSSRFGVSYRLEKTFFFGQPSYKLFGFGFTGGPDKEMEVYCQEFRF